MKVIYTESPEKMRENFSFYDLNSEILDIDTEETTILNDISKEKITIVLKLLDKGMDDSFIKDTVDLTDGELTFIKENHLVY